MTLHGDQDALYTAMKARWVEVDKAAKEWTVKLAELSQMWSKQTGKESHFVCLYQDKVKIQKFRYFQNL